MNVKKDLLNALAEAEGDYISGAALAERIGVSRNAVWKAVKSLQAEGYSIDSVTAKGYRLASDNNRLSAEVISAGITAKTLGGKIIVLDEVDSTNNYAKKLVSQGALHGTTVIADRQTGGKGRLGRTFSSPPETGLYMSVIVRPECDAETAAMITTAAAVAAAESVELLCGHRTDIKWVNDLYINGRKICGILTEASMSMETMSMDYAVIGIGINVRSVKDIFDAELLKRASSIEDETGVIPDRNRLCAGIVNRLERVLGELESREFLAEYRRREILTGHTVTATVGNEVITAEAIGIDDNANLIVRTSDGTERHLGSGEANLCRISE